MTAESRPGRPRVSSREAISEAAGELFLEQGYDTTSVSDIAQRAGVSRSSFFNYFSSKADVVWFGFDRRLTRAREAFGQAVVADIPAVLRGIVRDFEPDALALALAHSTTMRLEDEIFRDVAVREASIASAIAQVYEREGTPELVGRIAASAWAAGLFGALQIWSREGAGREPLSALLEDAITAVNALKLP